MGNLLDLAFYNPTQLKDDDFLRGFVARQDLVTKILARLGEITPKNLAQHRLIVGQRGMGKTSLLRRIAIGVRDTPALAAVLLPLRFREEQYNVHNLHVFWCNCLDALGDWFEASGKSGLADQLDREVATLNGNADDSEGSGALAVFKEWLQREGKRPLLMLDNIDLIFNGLKDKQWSLRRTLQEAGGIVAIGASAGFLEATSAPDAPFYDFFQVDVLEKLGRDELLASLRQLAEARGESGRKVTALLAHDPGRIHTLYDLTGGNPRTLVMLYLMLEASDEGDLMRDLERLLDQATPLYKARVEDLSSQARVVFDAVALTWNPVTAADTATISGLETATVSTQLDRLTKDGVLEKVGLSTTSRTGFQVSERFFNIWYLMRHASRRQRSRLRWLTEFLRKFYSPRELSELAVSYMTKSNTDVHSTALMCMAIAEATTNASHRQALNHHATRLLESYCQDTRKKVEDIIDLADLHPTTHAMTELKRQVLDCDRTWGGIKPGEFWDMLGGSVSLSREMKTRVAKELTTLSLINLVALQKVFKEEQEKFCAMFGDAKALEGLRRAVREGLMDASGDFRGALATAKYYRLPAILPISANFAGKSIRPEADGEAEELKQQIDLLMESPDAEKQQWSSTFWNGLGNLLRTIPSRYAEAETAYRKGIESDPQAAYIWNNLGHLLQDDLRRYEEAEAAYRQSIEIDRKSTHPWHGLGNLLQNHIGRYEEAEVAYRQAVEIAPKNASAWNDLGNLLQYHMGRYDEAEAAYRKAIEFAPKNSFSWNGLGNLLQTNLGRYEEAKVAYRKAIEFGPEHATPWNGLGNLLACHLEQFEEAEAAYHQAIVLDPKCALPWNGLGNLLKSHLSRYEEAEAAYRQAIVLDPKYTLPWNGLGNLLKDHLYRLKEAEVAYLKAIELNPKYSFPLGNLAYLLLAQPGREEEAETYYKDALDKLPAHGASLLKAFHALAMDNFGKAVELLEMVLTEGHPELFNDYHDDLLRFLRLAAQRGYGDKLLAWLDESGLGDRYWPHYAAYEAYLHGEERLGDVNPEVRGAATNIFNWLVSSKPTVGTGASTIKKQKNRKK